MRGVFDDLLLNHIFNGPVSSSSPTPVCSLYPSAQRIIIFTSRLLSIISAATLLPELMEAEVKPYIIRLAHTRYVRMCKTTKWTWVHSA